ncbi:MAG: hypothetical protein LBG72_09565, partial [Spirochaetaceae bacterium]|nr:hypothetical protein [Spirochaetaceae bacterium]
AGVMLLPLPDNSYELALIDKNYIAANTTSPKIAVVGGSNAAFGIDSAAMQNSLHLPVVNMGCYAGVGLGRMLDNVSPFLHEGDILLVIPEYNNFTDGWNGGALAYEVIFDIRQTRLLRFAYYGLPNGFVGYLSMHLRGIVARSIPSDLLTYTRDGFNEYGDYVKHLTMKPFSFSPDKNIGSLNTSSPNQSYLKYFYKFIDDFTARGLTVVLSYPCYEEQSYRNSAALIQELDKAFRAKENLLVISRPQDYCFPASLFFDTTYHLNAEGRALRTERLLNDLR